MTLWSGWGGEEKGEKSNSLVDVGGERKFPQGEQHLLGVGMVDWGGPLVEVTDAGGDVLESLRLQPRTVSE